MNEYVHVSRPVSFANDQFIPMKLTEAEDKEIENAASAVFDTYMAAETSAHQAMV